MKVKILLASLLAMVISLSASALEIDLKLHNVTIREAIAALNKMENWSIIVNSDEIDLSRKCLSMLPVPASMMSLTKSLSDRM